MKIINKIEGNLDVIRHYAYRHGLFILWKSNYKFWYKYKIYTLYIPFISKYLSKSRFKIGNK